ncbi:MAG: prephenate dehydrogenase [Verrucomicrobiia bacterium]
MHFQKIALLGVGLLGGSLGLAVSRLKLAGKTVGYVRREASLEACRELQVVDEVTLDLEVAVTGADLVVMCTPLGQMKLLGKRILPHLGADAIVTDVGSVKGVVVDELEPLIASTGACFIGSHPMAGSEQSGPAAASATLYENAMCVVTPTSQTPVDKLQAIEKFWQAVGAKTLRLAPDLHDDLTSRCSHLPHIVAAELANYVLSPTHPVEQGALCATGFRDTTRIASGSPEMWNDIVASNRKHLHRVLGVFIEDLQEFHLALERNDMNAVMEFFNTAKSRRDQWQENFNRTREVTANE